MTDEAAKRFGPLAAAYAASRAHSTGRTLALLLERLEPGPGDVALDVATGAGPTALAVARHAGALVAHDRSPPMVRHALAAARAEGKHDVLGVVSPAEQLPFGTARFTLVTCRNASHHFGDLSAALGEMARVLRPGGRIGLVDIAAAEDPELRSLQHRVDVLHDPTHRRTWTRGDWAGLFEAAGLRNVVAEGGVEEGLTELPEGTNVADWCRRSRTPPDAEQEIRRLLLEAPARLRSALRVQGTGPTLRFELYKVLVTARR